jgi:predicted nucleic acid-binding protein
MSSAATGSIDSLLRSGEQLFILSQNVIEFWCVATRPESSNGLGLSIPETKRRISAFRTTLLLLPDTHEFFARWEQLVDEHQVAGKQVYDARLVAAMLVHSLTHILTFNDGDFKRYQAITVINPQNIN